MNGDSADLGEVFTVERIVRKRRRKGRWEYLIKWKGYSSRHNTWEPDDNIFDRGLIYAFETAGRKDRKRQSKLYTDAKFSPQSLVEFEFDRERESKPVRRHVVIDDSSSSDTERNREENQDGSPEAGICGFSARPVEISPNRARVVREDSDEDHNEIEDNPQTKLRLESLKSLSSEEGYKSGEGEHEDGETNRETTPRLPIRLTIRHSSCTIGKGLSEMKVSTTSSVTKKTSDRRRKRTKKKKSPKEETASDYSSSISSDTDDDEDWRVSTNRARIKSRSSYKRKRPTVCTKPVPDPMQPPQLQVMVSDSELWFINERNTKHKQETTSDDKHESMTTTGEEREALDGYSSKRESVSYEDEEESGLNVVITDVSAHNYSVIIKECFQPNGFFKNSMW